MSAHTVASMFSRRFEASLAEVCLSVACETAGPPSDGAGTGGEASPTRPKPRGKGGADNTSLLGAMRPLLRLRTLFVFTSSDPHPFMEPVFSPTFAQSMLSPYTR